jgi:hypothetical protein
MSKKEKTDDQIKKHITSIDVYTDGSLIKTSKGDLRGCGYGIYFPGKELKNVSAPFTISPITNNRAELHAIHQAILRIIRHYTFDLINIYIVCFSSDAYICSCYKYETYNLNDNLCK